MENERNLDSVNVYENLISKLSELRDKADGEDKCIICQAIKELESNSKNSNNNWMWMFPILALCSSFGGKSVDTEAFMKGYINASNNIQEEGG